MMVGKTVYHRKYGKGEITKIVANSNYYVKFENMKREVVFPPDSFTDEYFMLSESEGNTPKK